MISRETVQKIMDAVNIVDVVSEFVTLKRAGSSYRGLCPFHNEKTPSFYVSPSRGIFKCFSCGKGGNAVHFLMEHEQLTYPEALRWLARKYNIEVHEEEQTDEEREAENVRESMFALNEWAAKYFQDILHNHADGVALGMQYFRSRGFRDDTIREFSLGFCPRERSALAEAALAKGFKEEFLVKTGLCYKRDDGRIIDRFSGRVMFPVHTVSGRIVAFGGRVMTSEKVAAKYVNSPESEIYNKRSELYGLFLAKHSIQKEDRCFLVEGYTDVISMHQSGICNVVASSGTSLTPGQIRLIRRFTKNITVLYDGDRAGIKASIRGIDMLLAEGMNVKVLLLPDGDDPDSFARKHSPEDYKAYIDSHQTDFIRFKTELYMEENTGNDPVAQASLVDSIVTSIALIPDKILRSMYIRECAATMHLSEELLVDAVARTKREKFREARKAQEREANAMASDDDKTKEDDTVSADTSDNATANDSVIKISKDSKNDKLERVLAKIIVLYGSRSLGNVETADGTVEMNVIDFIKASLEADGMEIENPLYRKIYQEAVEHSHDEGFNSQQYFLDDVDVDISREAAEFSSVKYQLRQSQINTVEKVDENLSDVVSASITNYKLAYVERETNSLLVQMSNPDVAKDEAKMTELVKRYSEMKNIEMTLAKHAGGRVVLS